MKVVSALVLLITELILILLCQDLYGSVGTVGAIIYAVFIPNLAAFSIYLLSSRRIGTFLFLLIAVTSLSYFSFVRLRANAYQQDIEVLVTYLEDFKKRTGSYPEPENLQELIPNRVRSHISEYQKQEEGIYLFYHLATPAIGHWYSSKSGWGYSDD